MISRCKRQFMLCDEIGHRYFSQNFLKTNSRHALQWTTPMPDSLTLLVTFFMTSAPDMMLHVIATSMCHAEIVFAEFRVRKQWSFTAQCDPRQESCERQKSSCFPFFWQLHFVFFLTNCKSFQRTQEDAFFCKNTEEYRMLATLTLKSLVCFGGGTFSS